MKNNPLNYIAKFPKKRNELSNEFKDIYQKIYLDNREGVGLGNKISQLSEGWAHRIIEIIKKRIKKN